MEEKSTVKNFYGDLVEVPLQATQPENGYWSVSIQIIYTDDKGKMKKRKEYHLVDAFNMAEMLNKVDKVMTAMYDGDETVIEWKIVKVGQTSVMTVY